MPQSFNAFDWLTVTGEHRLLRPDVYRSTAASTSSSRPSTWWIRSKTLFKNLSGGLKQRVGIATALINDPEIVFLDEPTTGLDPKARRDVWEAIKALKSHGKTVFLTTHYMDEAYYLADRIDVINHGKIIAEGTPEDLINSYGGGNTLIIRECSSEAIELLSKEMPSSKREGHDIVVRLPENDGMAIITKAVSLINDRHVAPARNCTSKNRPSRTCS